MSELVTMQSPDGETRDVDQNGPDLVPLMVKGWKQVQPGQKTALTGAAKLPPAKPGDPTVMGTSEVK
jgi:hypothetical protein